MYFLFIRVGYSLEKSPAYEISFILFLAPICVTCYIHLVFVTLLSLSISYFLIAVVKDYHLTIDEVDDGLNENLLELTKQQQKKRINKLIDCIHYHRQLIE